MQDERDIRIVDVVSLGQTIDTMALIKRGLNVNEPDGNGNYPVTVAASRNDLETLKVLIEAGANVNRFNRMGQTAIDWARRYNNTEMIELIESAEAAEKAKRAKLKG